MKLSTFYGGMIAILVVGGGALWYASRPSADAAQAATTGPADTTVFPGYPIGNPNAPVEIVEYGDFVCPFCGMFAVITEPDVRENLIQTGRVHWIYRDRPLNIEGHGNAPVAHLAAACANEQGKFWEMHDQLYFNQAAWAEEGGPERKFRGYADAIHLDMDRYNRCMSEGRYAGRIKASAAAADKDGITSTPVFFANGHRLSMKKNTYDELKAIVDSIAKLTPPAPAKAAPATSAPAKTPAKAPAKAKSKS
jgi:protein-disulfide isomerase